MPLIRLYPPDLPRRAETALVSKLIADMQTAQCWQQDEYFFHIGETAIWTANARYADMKIGRLGQQINIGYWNARRLRKAIKKKRAEMLMEHLIQVPEAFRTVFQ